MDNDCPYFYRTNITCHYNISHSNKSNPNLIKNSHQFYLTSKYKPCNSDIDPDTFYYNQMQNETSSYYLEDEFNSMLIQRNIDNNFQYYMLMQEAYITI